MNIKSSVKDILYDKKYYLLMYDDIVYIYGKNSILLLDNDEIIIRVDPIIFKIKGKNLKINKATTNEISIKGNITNVTKE